MAEGVGSASVVAIQNFLDLSASPRVYRNTNRFVVKSGAAGSKSTNFLSYSIRS